MRLPFANDKLHSHNDDPLAYSIPASTVTCWLDYRLRGRENKEEFLVVQR
jgi:hypothetical protein